MRWELRERTTSDVSRDAMETVVYQEKSSAFWGGAGRHEGQLLEKEGQDQTLVDLCDKLNLWDATHNTREGH